MKQEVKYIDIKDLVLWTENPRDLIDEKATAQKIVDMALDDKRSKWTLSKLSKDMGDYYDYSELPTVVYHGKKPVVYDGNRRIILGKIKHGLVSISKDVIIQIPTFPELIPCNVCDEKTALNNVYRKHSNSGSWDPLERDIFLHKFMGQEKSAFLILEEDTAIISTNPHLNQRFVKEEVLDEENLSLIGFTIKKGRLNSIHDDSEALSILTDISQKVKEKKISTRENRGKVMEVLEPSSQQLIDNNKDNKLHTSNISFSSPDHEVKNQRLSKRVKKSKELFGGKLYLQIGDVSNLYRDIVDLYDFYEEHKESLSQSFPGLIRMSLRLLCETAANDNNKKFDDYLTSNFENAKKTLNQNIKTTLSNHQVSESSIIRLLHTGAHNYQSSGNIEQTMALSIIIGVILTITHGKDDKK
jgi:hypothetical protein